MWRLQPIERAQVPSANVQTRDPLATPVASSALRLMDIADFSGTAPELLPEQFLTGDLEGWGVIERLTGGLQQRFTVNAHGSWDKAARLITFTETWTFDDGRQDTLSWRIVKGADGRYSGQEARSRARRKATHAAAPSTGAIRATRRRRATGLATRQSRWC